MSKHIVACTIVDAIGTKHAKDIFIPECKTGPTWAGTHFRFDALVITKSWVKPAVIGYEVKVSRQDFLHDSKWTNYLDFCNEFYFVCPPKLIGPNEVSDDVGLYWTSGAGTKIYQKKKAKYRDIQIPDSLWRYILMWRARIGDEIDAMGIGDRQQYWRKWLEDRKIDHQFGGIVSHAIREEIRKKIRTVEDENERFRKLIDKYDDIRRLLVKLEFDADQFSEWDVQRRISVGTIDTRDANQAISNLERSLVFLKSFVDGIKKQSS